MADTSESRIAFEAWFSDEGLYPPAVERNGDRYVLANAQQGWIAWDKAWTASRAAALEEAARMCEWRAHAIDHGGNRYVRSSDALQCAAAVRGLRDQGKKDEKTI